MPGRAADAPRRGTQLPDFLLSQLSALNLKDDDERDPGKDLQLHRDGRVTSDNSKTLYFIPQHFYGEFAGDATEIRIHNGALQALGVKLGKGPDAPHSIATFHTLTIVEITDCQLATLPAGFGKTPVHTIIVARNLLRKLPRDIADGPLRELDVQSNLLEGKLPSGLNKSATLQVLRLGDNHLTSKDFPDHDRVPDAQVELKELQIDEAIAKARGGQPPYPLLDAGDSDGPGQLIVIPAHLRAPVFLKHTRASRYALLPPKDHAKVKFAEEVTVGERKIEPHGHYAYHDVFGTHETEIVVTSVEMFEKLSRESTETRRKDGTKGPISKVAQIIIEGDEKAGRILPLIRHAVNVRQIIIRDCHLFRFPDDFYDGLNSLTLVDFRGNSIRDIPSSFARSSVEVALFDDNYIRDFPVLPKMLHHFSICRNCLGVSTPITGKHFELARALEEVMIAHNLLLPENLFPEGDLPTQLSLKVLELDERALPKGAGAFPIQMQDGCSPRVVKKPLRSWQKRLEKFSPYGEYKRDPTWKKRIGKEK